MNKLIVLAIILIGTSCRRSGDATSYRNTIQKPPDITCNNKSFSDDDLDNAALKVINSRLPYLTSFSASTESIAEARRQSADLRAWVLTLPKGKIQRAYAKWIAVSERGYDEIEKALKAEIGESEQEKWRTKFEAEQARAKELAHCLPQPPEGK